LDLERILAELELERDRISQAITLLKGANSLGTAPKTTVRNGKASARPRSRMSAAARKRMSDIMKKRWAERRKKAKSS
jgi:hypothetical protein